MTEQNRRLLLPFVITAVVIILDRVTKIYIRGRIGKMDSVGVLPGWLRIIHTENPGAAFGLFAQAGALVHGGLLIGISLLVMFFVASALVKPSGGVTGRAARLGLGLILGGAAGNLFDRIFRGTVTDFIEVYRGTWSFPAFNIADSAITVGSILLLIDLLFLHGEPVQERSSAESPRTRP